MAEPLSNGEPREWRVRIEDVESDTRRLDRNVAHLAGHITTLFGKLAALESGSSGHAERSAARGESGAAVGVATDEVPEKAEVPRAVQSEQEGAVEVSNDALVEWLRATAEYNRALPLDAGDARLLNLAADRLSSQRAPASVPEPVAWLAEYTARGRVAIEGALYEEGDWIPWIVTLDEDEAKKSTARHEAVVWRVVPLYRGAPPASEPVPASLEAPANAEQKRLDPDAKWLNPTPEMVQDAATELHNRLKGEDGECTACGVRRVQFGYHNPACPFAVFIAALRAAAPREETRAERDVFAVEAEDLNGFGAYLRERRVAAGLSLRECAAARGMTAENFGKIERGHATWATLADVLLAAAAPASQEQKDERAGEGWPVRGEQLKWLESKMDTMGSHEVPGGVTIPLWRMQVIHRLLSLRAAPPVDAGQHSNKLRSFDANCDAGQDESRERKALEVIAGTTWPPGCSIEAAYGMIEIARAALSPSGAATQETKP